MSNSTEQYDLVFFKALSWSAPISESPTRKFILYLLCGDLKPCRQTFNNDHEGLAMAFACGQVTQHTYRLPVAYESTMAINERGY
jgi:hypothetical protein